MWIKRMSYERIWAGPGLGMATNAEIAFESGENKPILYVSFSDGPAGVRYDVTKKSVQDVMTGAFEDLDPLDEADFLESYTSFEATQRHSKYRFVFSELESYTQRMLNIDEAMKEYESDQTEPVKPFKVELYDVEYKYFGTDAEGDFGEDENLSASYVGIDGNVVNLAYRHDPDGSDFWGAYDDGTGTIHEFEEFEETQDHDFELRDGFKAFRDALEAERKKRLGSRYRKPRKTASSSASANKGGNLVDPVYQKVAKSRAGIVEKAHAVYVDNESGTRLPLDYRKYKDGREVWELHQNGGKKVKCKSLDEAMQLGPTEMMAVIDLCRFVEKEQMREYPAFRDPRDKTLRKVSTAKLRNASGEKKTGGKKTKTDKKKTTRRRKTSWLDSGMPCFAG